MHSMRAMSPVSLCNRLSVDLTDPRGYATRREGGMDFDAAVAYMDGLLRFGVKLGNERFEAIMERLGNPQRRYGIAHVAGTKGKGSTTAMIAAILHAHGFRVGGYYSPYVYDLRERVQVDGEMIPAADF